MKHLNIEAIQNHFNLLSDRLQEDFNRNAIFIIEYLINFLGCAVLSGLGKDRIRKLSKDKNISDLTAGRWVSLIDEVLSRETENELLLEIKDRFCDKNSSINPNIKNWIELRNIFSHDIILPDLNLIEEECAKKFISLDDEYKNFIKSIIQISQKIDFKSNFFRFHNEKIHIYSGIDDDYIKYRHFCSPIHKIRTNTLDFPISVKEVFLSLDEAKDDILWGYDSIEVKVKTIYPKYYKNKFQLYINNTLVEEKDKEYKDGDIISFLTKDLPFETIKFNDSNKIEVKAVRDGTIQNSAQKYIKIFKDIPEPLIFWQRTGTEQINIPIDTEKEEKISVNSLFNIRDISFSTSFDGQKKNLENQKYGEEFLFPIRLLSNTPVSKKITILLNYKDATETNRELSKELLVNFKPNFFEPQYVGDDRMNIIKELEQSHKPYLIIGQGGVGKTRLIQEFLKKIGKEADIITVKPTEILIKSITKHLGLYEGDKKKNKLDQLYERIYNWLEENRFLEKILWIQDCHEISNKGDINFLRALCRKILSSTPRMRLIIETRDESWNESARNLIEEMSKENIRNNICNISLQGLSDAELIKIMDSIFFGNNFSQDFKEYIVRKSDGIVYIFLQALMNLYDQQFMIYSNISGVFPCWTLTKSSDEIKKALEQLDYRKIININIEQALDPLDKIGLGEKTRDLLYYLYFYPLTFDELTELVGLDKSHIENIIERLKDNYVIKEDEKKTYNYHHQIKQDYCRDYLRESYLPKKGKSECDYFIMVQRLNPQYLREERNKRLEELLSKAEDSKEEKNDVITRENNKDDYKENYINKYIADNSIWRLSEPYLIEKVDYILEKYENEIDPLLIIKNYLHLFESDAKFFGYLDYFLSYFDICVPISSTAPTDIADIVEISNKIEGLIECRKTDKNSPYYYAFMGRFLSWKFFSEICLMRWVNEQDILHELEELSLCDLLFHVTEYIKDSIELLKDYLNRLEEIKLYDECSKGIELKCPQWMEEWMEWDQSDKYEFPTFFEDYCISLIHISGILALSDKAKYSANYIEFIREFFKKSNESKRNKYLGQHIKSIKEADLDYKYLLSLTSSFFVN